ncbi:NuoI/complex I 23 kDa subunit family protein [Dyadobacter psychrotolerans]|uniref:NADH-quinone oxidoreductase subunit I n=1 Tax=Dyadobacter psychrotolerans TaxID=2541721 RepID=A0A4V2Z3W1_9BACT|nr:NADH-quinone oxidoreductase subunit I [Dyadobacter psychrotolerans]TDE13728.1 NADH-quinone oxidoreductase subunit I [Dyadobacter psychrotolerans]
MQLTNRSKQVSNKEMTLMERAYLPAIATGLAITLKHFFAKKVTIQYPEVKRYLGPVFRGRHILKRDEDGKERCTACGLCAVACPAEAISMVAAERIKGEENLYREEKYAAVYEVNMLRCIFCGLCEEACPKQAVYLRHDEFIPVFSDRDQVIWGKDLLVEDMNNRYTREAWTKEEARALDNKRANGEVTNVVPRAIP